MKRRCILATTHVDRHNDRLTLGALESLAAQINSTRKPLVTIEHDLTIPPIGKMLSAWVESSDDGQYQLVVEQEIFEQAQAFVLSDGSTVIVSESESDRNPFTDHYSEVAKGWAVGFDPRNLEPGAGTAIIEDIANEAGVEIDAVQFSRKAILPDPEFVLYIAAALAPAIVAANIGSKMVEKAVERLADVVADDVAEFYKVARGLVLRSVKSALPINRPITYAIIVPGTPVLEFVIQSRDPDLILKAILIDKLRAAAAKAHDLRTNFAAMKIQFILDDSGEWRFNYLLTSTGAVVGTPMSLGRQVERMKLLTETALQTGPISIDNEQA